MTHTLPIGETLVGVHYELLLGETEPSPVLALSHVCVRFRSLPRDAVEQLLTRLDLSDPMLAGAVDDLTDDMTTFIETQ